MSWHRKVAWLEGMFIRPQHFQQQERFMEWNLSTLSHQLHPYGWGISEIAFDTAALKLGNVILRKCQAILPDGTVIDIPSEDSVPQPLKITVDDEGALVYLGVPLWRAGAKDFDRAMQGDANARYTIESVEVPDAVVGSNNLATIDLAGKKVALIKEKEYQSQYAAIAVARIKTVKTNVVELDESFIPPNLNMQKVVPLAHIIREIQGLTHKRSGMLANRMKSLASGGTAEMADFLLLQMLNRYQPVLDHFLATPQMHPEPIYQFLVQFAGELATFTHPEKRLPSVPAYHHDDLQRTFESLEPILQQPLSTMLDQSAILIDLEEKGFGISLGYIPEMEVASSFVLCVRADMPNEDLRRLLPVQAKIGPIDKINNLVNRQLPGVRISPLAVAPRQIPFYSGAVYFELDTKGQWWEAISASRGIALHIGSQFPDILLELWAIK